MVSEVGGVMDAFYSLGVMESILVAEEGLEVVGMLLAARPLWKCVVSNEDGMRRVWRVE